MDTERPVRWVASSKRDFREFPDDVQDVMGYALHLAQQGGQHASTKPLKGFGGAGVVEIIDDHQGDTFRTVYTVKFAEAVYVLHAFQKKSKQGKLTLEFDGDEADIMDEDIEKLHNQMKEMNKPIGEEWLTS